MIALAINRGRGRGPLGDRLHPGGSVRPPPSNDTMSRLGGERVLGAVEGLVGAMRRPSRRPGSSMPLGEIAAAASAVFGLSRPVM